MMEASNDSGDDENNNDSSGENDGDNKGSDKIGGHNDDGALEIMVMVKIKVMMINVMIVPLCVQRPWVQGCAGL